MFGDVFEDELQSEYGLTVGHWPQSIALSTVGGWLACRGAGQLSNRYGKIEDIVIGLDVVLADGTIVHTGGHARQSAGPDLTQLFVGSEGTLGIITGARLRARSVATANHSSAWAFPSFEAGADACRRIIQRGLAPAALRLYDAAEADRNWGTGDIAVLLAFDEGDQATVDATTAITAEECAKSAPLDSELVTKWFGHRNDVSALEALISRGYMVDTLELTVSWTDLPVLYTTVRDAIAATPGIISSTAHLSHSYSDGACLYFTFAGKAAAEGPDAIEEMYMSAWNAGTTTALAHGGSLSHHHGVGLNRARFMSAAQGEGATSVLHAMKKALDPNGILNPGKLGMPTAFDRRSILVGAFNGLFFALPAAILQRTVFSGTALAGVMLAIVFFAGALAGYAAARPLPPRALPHGAAAGVVTFCGAEIVYLIATRDFSEPLGLLLGIILFALVFASLGTIGAMVAVSRGARTK
jgi:alkyldihydroxyacetonephosphate synthase